MKKAYQKPSIYIEELSLVQQIASCGSGSQGMSNPFGQVNASSANVCGFFANQFGTIIFTDAVSACVEKVPAGVDFGGVCYNTVSPGHTIFAS